MKIIPKSFGKLSKDYVMTKMNQMLIQSTLRLGIHTLISCTSLTSLVEQNFNTQFMRSKILKHAISSILNRTISAQPYLELPITKLMNLILESEKYASPCCRNILVTLYKGGGNNDPDNYRGISIGSCLANYIVQSFITGF